MPKFKYYNGSAWVELQEKLSAQTAYSGKGSSTKVPKITTNALGQVTSIEEVTITKYSTYKHDIVITDSSNSYKISFTLFSRYSSAYIVADAIKYLYNGTATQWAKSSIPLNIVTNEWNGAVFLPRHTLSAVSFTGSGINRQLTSFTIQPMEGGIVYNQVQGLLTISSASYSFTVSNLSIVDTVTEMGSPLLI